MDINEIKRIAVTEYNRWTQKLEPGDDFFEEFSHLPENPENLVDSFYTQLTFGTSGIRGLLGPGPNRINSFVIKRATQGLAAYLKKQAEKPAVVVAYDTRHGSERYAKETAAVLCGNGIDVCVFKTPTPVSVLSYAIVAMGCDSGVMITASHNPRDYNGYKVFDRYGHQVVGETPKLIMEEINRVDYFDDIPMDEEGVYYGGEQIEDRFVQAVCSQSSLLSSDVLNGLKTVFTPLNGTTGPLMERIFHGIGYQNYELVSSQKDPDENFTTCPQPNPEKNSAYHEGYRVLDELKADIIIAADPDGDRIGCALRHSGMRTMLSGNQIGILMLDYLVHRRPPKEGQILIKSIATTPLAVDIARKYGLQVLNTLPGFKHMGEILAKMDESGISDRFYFAFEESNGFLISPFVHEKDGLSAAMLLIEIAAFHKSQGKDLVDRLIEIYEEFGICIDKTRSFHFNGLSGKIRMGQLMKMFREELSQEPCKIGRHLVEKVTDYLESTSLPKEDILKVELEDGSILMIRPSGTESKIKVYMFQYGDLSDVDRTMTQVINKFRN